MSNSDNSDVIAQFWVRTPELHLAHLALEKLQYVMKQDPNDKSSTSSGGEFDYRKLVARLMHNSVHDVDEISAVSDLFRFKLLPKECVPLVVDRLKNKSRREEYLAEIYALEGLLRPHDDYKRLPSANALKMTSPNSNYIVFYENAGPENTLPKLAEAHGGVPDVVADEEGLVQIHSNGDKRRGVPQETLLRMMRIEAHEGEEGAMQLFSKLRAHERARYVLAAFRKGNDHLDDVSRSKSALLSSDDEAQQQQQQQQEPTATEAAAPPPSPSTIEFIQNSIELGSSKDLGIERVPQESGSHTSPNVSIQRLPALDASGSPIESIEPPKNTQKQKKTGKAAPKTGKATPSLPTTKPTAPPVFSIYRNSSVDKNTVGLFFVVKLDEMAAILMQQIASIEMERNDDNVDEAEEAGLDGDAPSDAPIKRDAELKFTIEKPFVEFTFPTSLSPLSQGYKLKVSFDTTSADENAEKMRFKTLVGLLTLYDLIDRPDANRAYVVLFASKRPLPESNNTTTFIAQANRDVAKAFIKEFKLTDPIVYSFKGRLELLEHPRKASAFIQGVGPDHPPTKITPDEPSSMVGEFGAEDDDD